MAELGKKAKLTSRRKRSSNKQVWAPFMNSLLLFNHAKGHGTSRQRSRLLRPRLVSLGTVIYTSLPLLQPMMSSNPDQIATLLV
jgi:hypothetical protein